jgi:hypothetical protein
MNVRTVWTGCCFGCGAFDPVLSGNRSMANDLVQANWLRALERNDQFQPSTPLEACGADL